MGDSLYAKNLANKDTAGRLPKTSTLWDEMIDTTIQIEQEPGLLEDVLRALGDDASLPLSTVFSTYMASADHISYDRTHINGPAFNETTMDGSSPRRRWTAPVSTRRGTAARCSGSSRPSTTRTG